MNIRNLHLSKQLFSSPKIERKIKFSFLLSILFQFFSIPVFSQNVGINTANPESLLHLKSDTTNITLQLDSEIPVSGTKYGSTILLPSSVASGASAYCGALCTDWINDNAAALQSLDGNFMELDVSSGPILSTDGFVVLFQDNPNLPAGAVIEELTFQIDYEIIETIPGLSFGTSLQPPSYQPGAQAAEELPSIQFSMDASQPSQIGDGGLSLSVNDLQAGITFNIDYLVNIDPAIQGNLKIDRIRLKADFSYPSLVAETTTWKMNVEEGKFVVKNNETPLMSLTENGELNLTKLKMAINSGKGRVLTSNNNGLGTWQSLPTDSDLDGRNIDDTLTALPFPLKSSEPAIFEKNIQVGYSNQSKAGMIRFNPNNSSFEGHNGAKWVSLTATNTGWGSLEVTEQQAIESTDSLLGAKVDVSMTNAIAKSHTTVYFYEYDSNTEIWSEVQSFDFSDKVFDMAIDGDYAIVTYGAKDFNIYIYIYIYIFGTLELGRCNILPLV